MENQLMVIINESGLAQTKAQVLLEKFSNYFEIAAEWEMKAKSLVVTNESQKTEMKMADEGRKFLKQKRVDIEKTRKELKEGALREGQTIDAIAKILTNLVAPIENYLENQANFLKIQAENKRIENADIRTAELTGYAEFVPIGIDLGALSDIDYVTMKLGIIAQFEAKKQAELKAEQERIDRERLEAIERDRMRVENEKLKAEAIERERIAAEQLAAQKAESERLAKIEAEKQAKIQEQLRAERIERERIAAELQAKKDADEKLRIEIETAKRNAANAPDKEKLNVLIANIKAVQMPEVSGENAQKVLIDCAVLLTKVITYIESKINTL